MKEKQHGISDRFLGGLDTDGRLPGATSNRGGGRSVQVVRTALRDRLEIQAWEREVRKEKSSQ